MFGSNPYTQNPYGPYEMMGEMDPEKKKKHSLGGLLGMISPMGFMMSEHPQAGLAMLSPLGFGLSRLFK